MMSEKVKKYKITKEVRTAVVAILTILLFIWMAYFIKGKNLFTKEHTYYAIYKSTGGTFVSSPVVLNGLKVGRISDIGFVSEADKRIMIHFTVSSKVPMPINTIASIEALGLLSGTGIVLYLGNSTEYKKDGDEFISKSTPDLLSQLVPIKNKAELMLESFDSLLISLNQVLSQDNIGHLSTSFAALSNSLENIEAISNSTKGLLDQEKKNLADLISSFASVSRNLNNNSAKINNIISNISNISDTIALSNLSSTFLKLNTTVSDMSVIMHNIKQGNGSIGNLLYNDSLYLNVQNASNQLNLLLEDFRLNPKRYVNISVFGGKDKKDKKKKKNK